MRKLAVAAVALAASVTLGACGGSQAMDVGAPGSLLAAVTKTTENNTAKVDIAISGDISAVGQTQHIEMNGTGAFDFSDEVGSMSLTVPSTAGSPPIQVEEVVNGKDIYVKTTMADGTALTAKPWVKVNLDEAAKESGFDLNSFGQDTTSDPTKSMEMLEGSATNVTKVGKEELRGDKVTHYTMTLDLAKAAQEEKDADRKKMLEQAAKLYNQPIPAELWLDNEDRVRKLVMTIDMSKLTLGDEAAASGVTIGGNLKVSQEFYDFGSPVDVEIPPADQVMSASETMNAQPSEQQPAA